MRKFQAPCTAAMQHALSPCSMQVLCIPLGCAQSRWLPLPSGAGHKCSPVQHIGNIMPRHPCSWMQLGAIDAAPSGRIDDRLRMHAAIRHVCQSASVARRCGLRDGLCTARWGAWIHGGYMGLEVPNEFSAVHKPVLYPPGFYECHDALMPCDVQ